jgi:hypothetical protein
MLIIIPKENWRVVLYRYLIPVAEKEPTTKEKPRFREAFHKLSKNYIVQITSPPLTSGGLVMYSAMLPRIS